jgi:UDP-N-acetylglucosamine acyltransferase
MVNKVGLDRNGVAEASQSALRTAHRILFRDGLTIPNALSRIESEVPSCPEILHLLNFVRTSQRGVCK